MQELLYTSAPKGLKPGSSGFCTVISSAGMSAPVATGLESLSAYRPVYPPNDPQAALNPVACSHLQIFLAGQKQHVLSRVAAYGLDYSQRTNKIAHHVVIDRDDLPTAGPSWVLRDSGLMREDWDGVPKVVAADRPVPQGSMQAKICHAWQQTTGDAGWGGVLAEAFLKNSERLVYLVYEPGMDVLPLIDEAIALLPPERRWEVTFTTYFTKLPKGATCQWRCVLAGSPEANESRRHVQALRINLCEPMGKANGGEYVTAARTGQFPDRTESTDAPLLTPIPTSSESKTDNDAPLRIKPTSDKAPPPPQLSSRPPASHRKKKAKRTALWSTMSVLALVLVAGVSIFFLNKNGRTQPQTETKVAVAENNNPKLPGAPPVTPKIVEESPPPVQAPPKMVAPVQATLDATEPPAKLTEKNDNSMSKSGESSASTASAKDSATATAVMPVKATPIAADNDGQDHPSELEVLHWRPTVAKLEKGKTLKLLEVPTANETSQVLVRIPYDLKGRFKANGGTVEVKTPSTAGTSEANGFSPYLTFDIKGKEVSLTPQVDMSAEDINRFVLEIGQPNKPPTSVVFLHKKLLHPDNGRLAAANGLPEDFKKNSKERNSRILDMFQVRGLDIVLLEDHVVHASVNNLSLQQKESNPIPKGIKFRLAISLNGFVKKQSELLPICEGFQEGQGDLSIELIVKSQEQVEDEITPSTLDASRVAVKHPVLHVSVAPELKFGGLDGHLLQMCKSYWENEIQDLDFEKEVSESFVNKETVIKWVPPSFVRTHKDVSTLLGEVEEYKKTWTTAKGNLNLADAPKKTVVDKIDMKIRAIQQVAKFLEAFHDLLVRLNEIEKLDLIRVRIDQKAVGDSGETLYMPFILIQNEALVEQEPQE